jgi:hypothetical protein
LPSINSWSWCLAKLYLAKPLPTSYQTPITDHWRPDAAYCAFHGLAHAAAYGNGHPLRHCGAQSLGKVFGVMEIRVGHDDHKFFTTITSLHIGFANQ